jgi:hypothetical protein
MAVVRIRDMAGLTGATVVPPHQGSVNIHEINQLRTPPIRQAK